MKPEHLEFAKQLQKQLLEQDNACTSHPMYMVQGLYRVYGIDTDFDPQIAWLSMDEYHEVEPKLARRLEKLYEAGSTRVTEKYHRVGYHEEWRTIQPFLTAKAANDFIRWHKGKFGELKLQVFVDSGYRNEEWQALRAFFKEVDWCNLSHTPGDAIQ